ncbi:MAG TPA: peptidase S14 [Xanthomonadaceae bacterium]|nr:peptidase S14 [Xanthomonadaceae bacterium]
MKNPTRLLAQQIRLATLQPATFIAESRTVEVVWTAGAVVVRYDHNTGEYYNEELGVSTSAIDMSRLASGAAPVLNSHGTWSLDDQIGVVERAWLDGNVGRALIRLSGREDVAGIVQDIRDGIIRNISVGYSVQTYEITRDAGNKLPTYRATRWTPMELSFVTVPADAGAATRGAPGANPNTPNASQGTPCEFVSAHARNCEENQMDENDAPNGADTANAAGNGAAPATTTDVATAERAALARAADITALAQRHGMTDKAAEWIRAGSSIEQVRATVLDELAKRDAAAGGSFNRVSAGVDQVEKHRAAAVQALMARQSVVGDDGKVVRVEQGNPFRGLSLVDIARRCLEQAGTRTDGMSRMDLVGRAFTQTSSDFPILLENAMQKTLQAAYAAAADTWSRWCATGSVADFRDHPRYRVGSLQNLQDLTEAGEFRNRPIPDADRSRIRATTKGNIINLSRQAIINDDLGAFLGLATAFGRAARRTIEADVYALLRSNSGNGPTMQDGQPLFHATHNNIGTTQALTVTAVDNARTLMARQTDFTGAEFLDLRPSIWLGPVELGGTARVINDSQFDPDRDNKLQRANMVARIFADIVDTPRLLGSDNRWYAISAPAEAPVFEVAFLDGNDAPYLELENGFDVDGARWKARLDFGVAAIDWRGIVRGQTA